MYHVGGQVTVTCRAKCGMGTDSENKDLSAS